MTVIICAKYKKNPSRTVDATERTRFSNSRPNDLEDIGQGSSHATHPLMLLIICTKYGKNPSWTVDVTGWTPKVNGQTDRQTDRRTGGQTGWIQYTPPNFVAEGIKKKKKHFRDIQNLDLTKPLGRHFTLPNHTPDVNHITSYILAFITKPSNTNAAQQMCLKFERDWIYRLRTNLPHGLNAMDWRCLSYPYPLPYSTFLLHGFGSTWHHIQPIIHHLMG